LPLACVYALRKQRFGTKYPDYTPVLPSKVNQVLGRFSFERLIPSKGLTAGQISYALKELGFGVKIYSENAYKQDFLKFHLCP